MPLAASRITLSTTPTLVAESNGEPITVLIKGASAQIFVGGADVDSTDGFPIDTTDGIGLDLGPSDDLYLVASTGTPTVQVLVTRQ